MAKYLITYDLKKSSYDDRNEDYQRLYKILETYYEYYAKITESSWIIKTYKSIQLVKSEIMNALHSYDALFICEIKSSALWNNCIDYNFRINEILE